MLRKNRILTLIFLLAILRNPCVQAENPNIGALLANDTGKILFHLNKEKKLIPASILKILTSLAAINILGQDFHFSTNYIFDKKTGNLYIRGFGDPLFTSEIIQQLCYEISLKTKKINNIILDNTYFDRQIHIPGRSNSIDPYNAPVGALCANFNTVYFKYDKLQKKYISGEVQTPLFPMVYDNIKNVKLKQGRIILTKHQSMLYPGLLINFFLEKNQVDVSGSVILGYFDINKGTTYSFVSPFEIKNIVQKLLKYSNNYIANQLFLAAGAKQYNEPADLKKSIKAVKLFAKEDLTINDLIIVEGSGLSRSNLISPEQMLKVLIKFKPFYSLLKHNDKDFFKTGTLSDVSSRAGYIIGKDNRLYPYIIMINNQERADYNSIMKKFFDIISKGY